MDIFSKLKPDKQPQPTPLVPQAIKQANLTPASRQLSDRQEEDAIIEQYDQQRQNLQNFIRNEYRLFDFKVNNCTYQCYGQAKSYQQMDDCRKKCNEGSHKFSNFVKARVDALTESIHDCLEKAKGEARNDHYEQAKKCYRAALIDFQRLQSAIRQESRYYQ